MHGRFISFEGTEGCGKSTQIRRLLDRLRNAGHDPLGFREPGGTPLGESIRNLLQHEAVGETMRPETELLLFAASRAQLVRESIGPALEAGKIVLCDRFMDSTTVYQGVARKLDPADVRAMNNFAVGPLRPHLTVLLDLPPRDGLRRARATAPPDRMERESLEFFNAVRQGYLDLAAEEKERFLILDAGQTPGHIENEIWNAVQRLLT